MKTLVDILTAPNRDHTTLQFYRDFRAIENISRSRISEVSATMAQNLAARKIRGEPILLVARTEADFVLEFFAVIRSGNMAVPLAPASMVPFIDYAGHVEKIKEVTRARFAFSGGAGGRAFSDLKILNVKELKSPLSTSHSLPEIGASDTAIIQFSSGSTHDPKGVMLTHGNLLANLKQIKTGMAVTESDVLASWLPFYHDMGLIGGLLASLYNNVCAHFAQPADFVVSPSRWLELVSRAKATITMGPDFSYRMCARKISAVERKKLDLSQLRLALSGAEPVSEQTCRLFNETFSSCGLRESALFPVYGLAEMSLAATFPRLGQKYHGESFDRDKLLEGKVQKAESDQNAVQLVSCGSALPGVEIRLVDEFGTPVNEGCVGRVLLTSPSMTAGYYRNPDQTRELLREGWLQTGDLGFLKAGELFIIGREKDIIKLNGRSFHPSELEQRMAAIPRFKMGRIAAFSRMDFGGQAEIPHVAVESREVLPWRRNNLRREIIKSMTGLIPLSEKNVFILPPCSIPRTTSGKTKRFELKILSQSGRLHRMESGFLVRLIYQNLENIVLLSKYKAGAALGRFTKTVGQIFSARRAQDPKREIQIYLSRVLAEVTQTSLKDISPSKPFHDYRVDSLALINMTARLEKDIAALPLTDFIEKNTIESLGQHLLDQYPAEVNTWLAAREAHV